MPTVTNFEDLEAWQVARDLCRRVYAVSRKAPLVSDFVLRDQLRRAAVSVTANIAEGFERGGTAEFVQFLSVAKGSAGELRAHLYVALDQGYIDSVAFQELSELASSAGRVLGGLIAYLRRSGVRGSKYKATGAGDR
jgi:four helix bundle protein